MAQRSLLSNNLVGEKRCTGCGETKPLSDFSVCRAISSGVTSRCRVCVNKARRAYLKTPKGQSQARRRGGYAASYEEKRARDIERFWVNVDKTEGCWIWHGPTSHDGYGRFQPRALGKQLRVNRAVWWVVNGVLPPSNLLVCHKCDNPPCVNPEHLFLGTYKDNNYDAIQKGRIDWDSRINRGSKNGRAKLTEENIRFIRGLPDSVSRTDLAKEFGVSVAVISSVVLGKSWKCVQ